MKLDLAVKIAEIAALFALTAVLLEGVVLGSYIAGLSNQAKATLLDVSRTAQDVVGTTAEVRRTLKATQASEEQTVKNSAAATAALTVDLTSLNGLIEQADEGVIHAEDDEGALVSAAAETHSRLDAGVDAATASFQRLSIDLNELEPSLLNVSDATSNLAKTAADPAADQTLQNVAGVTADLHTETSLLVDRTKQAFKPENKYLALLKTFSGGTLTAAELWYYFSH